MRCFCFRLPAVLLLLTASLACGCSKGGRSASSDEDAGDIEVGTLIDAGTAPDWDLPGWTLSWVAQAGGSDWYDNKTGDSSRGIVAMEDGSIFVTGSLYSEEAVFGVGTTEESWVSPPDDGVVFLTRYDSEGVPQWLSTASIYGGYGWGITLDPGGGVLVSGRLDTNGVFPPAVFGEGEPNETSLEVTCGYSPFVARWESDGTFSWVRCGECIDESEMSGLGIGAGIATFSDGSSCQAGLFRGQIVLGSGEPGETLLTSGGPDDGDGYVARYGNDGDLVWARRVHGESGDDICLGSATLPDGACAVGCNYTGTVTIEGGNADSVELKASGSWGAMVAVYDSGGNLSRVSDLGVSGEPVSGSMAAPWLSSAGGGELVAAGSFSGSMELDPSGSGQTVETEQGVLSFYLTRLDEAGQRIWTSVVHGHCGEGMEGKVADGPYSLDVLPGGEIAVVGMYSGEKTFGPGEESETVLADKADLSEGWNGFVALYGQNGTLKWAIPVAAGPAPDWPNSNRAFSVSHTGDETLFVTGEFTGSALFGTGPDTFDELTSFGQSDIYSMRLDRVVPPG